MSASGWRIAGVLSVRNVSEATSGRSVPLSICQHFVSQIPSYYSHLSVMPDKVSHHSPSYSPDLGVSSFKPLSFVSFSILSIHFIIGFHFVRIYISLRRLFYHNYCLHQSSELSIPSHTSFPHFKCDVSIHIKSRRISTLSLFLNVTRFIHQ